MAVVISKQFFTADIVRGGEQGILTLVGTINLGTGYTTGGMAVDFSDIDNCPGNAALIGRPQIGISTDLSTYGVYDPTNAKVLAYLRADDTQVSNATDLSAASKTMDIVAHFRIGTANVKNFTVG